VLKNLVQDFDYRVVCTVAQRRELPEDILKIFAKKLRFYDAQFVINQKTTSPEVLKALAHHKDFRVLICLVHRVPLPHDVLGFLSQATSPLVRGCIAMHPDTPLNIMMKLARDKSILVRRAIQLREKIPRAISQILKNDLGQFDVTEFEREFYKKIERKFDKGSRRGRLQCQFSSVSNWLLGGGCIGIYYQEYYYQEYNQQMEASLYAE
jgi:hypothetical protein